MAALLNTIPDGQLPCIPILMGPTASGKSALALKWAQEKKGYIINADSMQVYKNFPILSAQPTLQEQQKAPHYLYGIHDVTVPYSAAEWVQAVHHIISTTSGTPIIVGGTGFYIKALIDGLSPIPDIAPDIRHYVRSLKDPFPQLMEQDPAMANYLNRHDNHRLARALEVILSTGKSLQYWQSLPPFKVIQHPLKLHVLLPPREALYTRINDRCSTMFANGAIEEVRTVYDQNLTEETPSLTMPGLKTIGYPEICGFLQGKYSLDHALTLAQTSSRQYAKRQYTWLRHQLKPYDPIYIN